MSDKFPEKARSLTKTCNDLGGQWTILTAGNARPKGTKRQWLELIDALRRRVPVRISPFLDLEFRLDAAHISNPREASDRHETVYILEGEIDQWVAEAEKVIEA